MTKVKITGSGTNLDLRCDCGWSKIVDKPNYAVADAEDHIRRLHTHGVVEFNYQRYHV